MYTYGTVYARNARKLNQALGTMYSFRRHHYYHASSSTQPEVLSCIRNELNFLYVHVIFLRVLFVEIKGNRKMFGAIYSSPNKNIRHLLRLQLLQR